MRQPWEGDTAGGSVVTQDRRRSRTSRSAIQQAQGGTRAAALSLCSSSARYELARAVSGHESAASADEEGTVRRFCPARPRQGRGVVAESCQGRTAIETARQGGHLTKEQCPSDEGSGSGRARRVGETRRRMGMQRGREAGGRTTIRTSSGVRQD